MLGEEGAMVTRKKVCVIGAGVSGLVTAKLFKQHGHSVTLVERGADLGGVWDPSRSYPEVQTQSPKDLYRYTDKAMPASYPEWPKGQQVHAYLREYARDNQLDALIDYYTTVTAMQTRSSGVPGWTLSLSSPQGQRREEFDFVAVCSGQFSDRHTPTHAGQAQFVGGGGITSLCSASRNPQPTSQLTRYIPVQRQ
jgi:dimethylaniline monooxygenase (N-oxide forming)